MTTYEVTATRSGDWWAIDVPAVPAVHTQAKRLDQVAPMAKEAIALALEVDEDQVAIELIPDPQHEAAVALGLYWAERTNLVNANANAAAAQRQTAHFLRWDGFSMRDIALLMGVAFQRVHQLVNEAPPSCPVCNSPGEWQADTRISHGPAGDPTPPREVEVLVARCSADITHWRYEGPSFDEAEAADRPPLRPIGL